MNLDKNAFSDLVTRSPLMRAADGVKLLIQREGLEAGRRLPAEDALAVQLSVSRSTLRKALDDLESSGWVKRERNRGCIVAHQSESSDSLSSRTLLVLNDTFKSTIQQNPDDGSTSGIQHGMVDAASAMKYNTLFVPMESINPEMERQILNSNPPGVVMLCWQTADAKAQRLASRFSELNIPVAAFGMDDCPEAVDHYDRVVSDHESGMVQLLDLLSRNGCKRILRVWTPPPETSWIVSHERAYERVAESLGLIPLPAVFIPVLPERIANDRSVFDMRTRVMAGYLAEHIQDGNAPEAIMVGTDCETFLVAAACRFLGLKPGEDILITGYDNYWHAAFERQYERSVPFATVDKRNVMIGAELVRLLDQRIADGSSRPPQLSRVEQSAIETQPAVSTSYRKNA